MTNPMSPEDHLRARIESQRQEIEQLRADISQAYYLRDKAEGRFCTALGSIEQLHAAVKTAQELAATRLMEIERLQKDLRRANSALVRHGVQTDPAMNTHPSDEPSEQRNPFDSAAILAAPRERRISMSFETQEQYEAALVFLDMADEGASRDASPADLVGALQDVVHTDPGPVRAAHAVRDASSEPCEHLRSEMVGEKRKSREVIFTMRKCLDCNKVFRVCPSSRTGEQL